MGLFSRTLLRNRNRRWFQRARPPEGQDGAQEKVPTSHRWSGSQHDSSESVAPEPKEQSSPQSLIFTEWRGPGVAVKIEGLPLTGPLYLSTSVGRPLLGTRDRLAIDPDLPIASKADDREGQRLPDSPRYPALEPGQRRTYLEWIAGRRRDPLIGDGYILLQLYAIEHRALLELKPGDGSETAAGTNADERAQLARLLERLLALYRERPGCAQALARAACAIRVLMADDGGAVHLNRPAGRCGPAMDTRNAIALKLAAGKALNARDLFLFRHTGKAAASQEDQRLSPELREAFRKVFRQRHRGGWKPSVQATAPLKLGSYEAASGDFKTDLDNAARTLPDPDTTDIGQAADSVYHDAQKRLWPLRMHLATGGDRASPMYATLLRAQGLSTPETAPAHAENQGQVVLDESKLTAIEAQSDQAAEILSKYFQEDEAESPAFPAGQAANAKSLDDRHKRLVQRLQTRPLWSERELQEEAKALGLRAMGAVELINEWSIEHEERPLLILDSPNWIVDNE